MGVLFNLLGSDVRLATWNRPRTSEELRSFVDARHARLPEGLEVE
jgi:hypothetical protein